MKRVEKEVLNLRHTFTSEERLKMGDDLAAAYNRKGDIDDEEAVIKAQFKERRATVDQTITSLTRNISTQFEMRNIDCRLEYDNPNPNEVSYFRVDTGELVKVRAFYEYERQQDLPLEISAAESQENIENFFGVDAEGNPKPEEPALADGPKDVVVADGPPAKPKKAKEVADPNSPADVAKAAKNLKLM